MGTQNRDTAAAILEASRKEYGYEKASLRRIAKEASVTTGAIYGYFAGKDALFAALTEDAAEELVELYTKVHSDFASLPPEEQPDMLNVVTEECVPWLVNYVYDHFEAFKLLLCCGAPGCGERCGGGRADGLSGPQTGRCVDPYRVQHLLSADSGVCRPRYPAGRGDVLLPHLKPFPACGVEKDFESAFIVRNGGQIGQMQ